MDASRRESELVFVYGTLRVGASNHHRMKKAEWLGRRVVAGRLYQVSWYPGFVPDENGYEVVGDLYRVESGQLRNLDEFEGVPVGQLAGEEYERTRIRVRRDPCGETWDDLPEELSAWVWVWRKETRGLVELVTGDWLDAERPRQPPWLGLI